LAPSRPARVFAVIVAVATTLGAGYFAVFGLVDPGGLVPGGDASAARAYATMMAARGIVLLGALLLFAILRSWRPLRLLLVINGVVQLADAVSGVARHHAANAVGPVGFAVVLLGAAVWLGRGDASVMAPPNTSSSAKTSSFPDSIGSSGPFSSGPIPTE